MPIDSLLDDLARIEFLRSEDKLRQVIGRLSSEYTPLLPGISTIPSSGAPLHSMGLDTEKGQRLYTEFRETLTNILTPIISSLQLLAKAEEDRDQNLSLTELKFLRNQDDDSEMPYATGRLAAAHEVLDDFERKAAGLPKDPGQQVLLDMFVIQHRSDLQLLESINMIVQPYPQEKTVSG